jgi:DNA-binding transcriptional regulator YhcF (GntR family)
MKKPLLRKLAEQLNINVNTVAKVYKELGKSLIS